jgi:LmbE family N-acetylglucosaminyl deacetylase
MPLSNYFAFNLSMIRLTFLALLIVSLFAPTMAQKAPQPNAAEIQHQLKKLTVLGSALYIAAHPDDENTRLITYLANQELMRTAYISLTRGDGGQNLIGPEIRELLGLIRTHELLEARKVDGGMQFFSRANDFGFSKTPEETFRIWDREQVLADLVFTIRQFKPDVLITRFPPAKYNYDTHGHHSASAILAEEAFKAAGDASRFPEQLKYVTVWQPKRLYWNTSTWFYKNQGVEMDTTGKLKLNVGAYNPLLGCSYTELAAQSRSKHASQGFGTAEVRGDEMEYLEYVAGDMAQHSMFEGVNTTWDRLPGGKAIGKLLSDVYASYNPANPSASVAQLLEARKLVEALPKEYWRNVKLAEIDAVIKSCLGLYLEAISPEEFLTVGQFFNVKLEAINRSAVPLKLTKVSFPFVAKDTVLNHALVANKGYTFSNTVAVPLNMATTQPHYLRNDGTVGMFRVDEQALRNQPMAEAPLQVMLHIEVAGQLLTYMVPVLYKFTEPSAGEIYRNIAITPPVTANLKDQVLVFADNKAKKVTVSVKGWTDNVEGEVRLKLPKGWTSVPEAQTVMLGAKGSETMVEFEVLPPPGESNGELEVVVQTPAGFFNHSSIVIDYSHIPRLVVFPKATAKLVRLDLKMKGQKIGYLAGAGDDVPSSLTQIGYQVTLLQGQDISPENLKQFDAVILGVRALNTIDELKFQMPIILEYAKAGGTVVMQYNTNHRLVTEDFAPYKLTLSRLRVTEEDAEVRILDPKHPILNSPNKITEKDFADWVQERGLYFPSEWAAEYKAILSCNDTGEKPNDGSLLVAQYGNGWFVYTGLSFFRELPAGVPGAYRLFANLISVGKE